MKINFKHIIVCVFVLFMVLLSVNGEAKTRYRGKAKQERIYRQRQAQCTAEQRRIQYQGIKKYNPRKLRRNAHHYN